MEELKKILKDINAIPKQKDDKTKLKKANGLLEYISDIQIDGVNPLIDDIMEIIDEYIQNSDELNMSSENNEEKMIDILEEVEGEISEWQMVAFDKLNDDYEEDYDGYDDYDDWDDESMMRRRKRRYDDFEDDYY